MINEIDYYMQIGGDVNSVEGGLGLQSTDCSSSTTREGTVKICHSVPGME